MCESIYVVVLMLPDPLHEIRCHTEVQRAIALAGKNVDRGQLHLWGTVRFSGLNTANPVQTRRIGITEGLGRKSIV